MNLKNLSTFLHFLFSNWHEKEIKIELKKLKIVHIFGQTHNLAIKSSGNREAHQMSSTTHDNLF